MKRLAILISGRGSNMVAIARACLEERINATVCAVIADKADAAGLARAEELGIPTQVVAAADFQETDAQGRTIINRAAFDQALAQALMRCEPHIIALAGFMRILSCEFVAQFEGSMLNIHPALLPHYRGLHTHRRVLEAGDRVHGASVHFVTAELDAGPVVLQSRLTVHPGETESELSSRVQATEHIIYPRAIGWLADGRLAWREGRAWFDGRPLGAPIVEEFS